ncbi:hypothetical protein RHGRI_020286 [Rhododendron griersonianum]|uniref:Uncharacterized protein n=1 Tax=Rhododendron griersonianum TaxID=479676 RepID=A0AAV6JFT7_9ERIC|nr:hypothetical protein RHGRI_020286 [Rhododendron griersonianum]
MSSQAISVLELLDRFLHSLSLSVPNSDCDAIKQKFKVCTCPKKTKSKVRLRPTKGNEVCGIHWQRIISVITVQELKLKRKSTESYLLGVVGSRILANY